MGMYTEFIFGCSLSKDTPKECIDALDYVINGPDKEPKIENPKTYAEIKFNAGYIDRTTSDEDIQAFIDKFDLRGLMRSCSYYFDAPPVSSMYFDDIDHAYHISSRANLKNYNHEIESFIEYIRPYINGGSGLKEVFAYVMYEEDEFPTIYTLEGDYDVSEYIKDKKEG